MRKKVFLIVFIALSCTILFAQEWSEPVNISNMENFERDSDIIVSPDGTLHCVWLRSYDRKHREIFYSSSTDEGTTWSTPISISQNDTLAMISPHIVADSKNNLYVSYDYNIYSPFVVMQKYDGIEWSKRDTVVNWYSYNNRIYIDNHDRIYVFWYSGDDKFYYKYLENDLWSDVIAPYNSEDFNIVHDAVVDQYSNIHIIGNYKGYISYFKYNKFLDQWYEPEILSDNTHLYDGCDIVVDTENNPHVVWHETYSDVISFEHATFYRYLNGDNWMESVLIGENSYGQQINTVNCKPYILYLESEPDATLSAVLYQQDSFGNWYGKKFLKSNGFHLSKFFVLYNKLCVLYAGSFNDQQFDIFFIKTKYGVGIDDIEDINDIFTLSQNFPNPVNDYTKFSYTLKQSGYCNLSIYDVEGKLIKVVTTVSQPPGEYTVEWDGKDDNGRKLVSGVYLYRLSLDNIQISKSLIIN